MTMGAATPLVSVAMITYDQEPFLRESIRSVLAQTLTDLELVVLDNGSSDATTAAVAEFDDPRVVYLRLERNVGPGAGWNRAVAACRGRFLALATGDDLSHPRRLEAQLAAYERAGGGVVFSGTDYIDEAGAPLADGHYPKDYFSLPPMTRGEVLARFFRTGNFVASISAFAELGLVR